MKQLVIGLVLVFLTALTTAGMMHLFSSINALNARVDRANVEYQFVVVDSTITVWDRNRHVGTVKLEGQLDSLIIADNQ